MDEEEKPEVSPDTAEFIDATSVLQDNIKTAIKKAKPQFESSHFKKAFAIYEEVLVEGSNSLRKYDDKDKYPNGPHPLSELFYSCIHAITKLKEKGEYEEACIAAIRGMEDVLACRECGDLYPVTDISEEIVIPADQSKLPFFYEQLNANRFVMMVFYRGNW